MLSTRKPAAAPRPRAPGRQIDRRVSKIRSTPCIQEMPALAGCDSAVAAIVDDNDNHEGACAARRWRVPLHASGSSRRLAHRHGRPGRRPARRSLRTIRSPLPRSWDQLRAMEGMEIPLRPMGVGARPNREHGIRRQRLAQDPADLARYRSALSRPADGKRLRAARSPLRQCDQSGRLCVDSEWPSGSNSVGLGANGRGATRD